MAVEGWKSIDLGSCCKIRRGITYTQKDLSSEKEGLPYLNMKSFKKDGGYNEVGLKFYSGEYKDKDLIKDNTLLIANTDLTPNGDILGLPALTPEGIGAALFSHHVTGIDLPNFLYKKFVYYYLCSAEYREQVRKISRGTTVQMLDRKAFEKMTVPLPSIQEQKKIAEILESVDDAIAKTETVIAQTERVKQGLLQQLLTRGIGHTKFKQSPLGEIPESWEVKNLREVCFDGKGLQTGPFGSQLHAHEYVEDGVPVIMPKDLINGVISSTSAAKITKEKVEALSKHILYEGDVIFSRRGDVGRCALISDDDGDVICGTGCLRARPNKHMIYSGYLIKYLHLPIVQDWIKENAVGQTMPNLNTEILGKILISVPSLEEQKTIFLTIQSLDTYILRQRSSLIIYHQLKTGLMSDLLTGRVRVNVDDSASNRSEEAA